MRLIDAEALKKALNYAYDCAYIDSKSKEGIVSDIIEKIDNAPTVEYPFYQEAYQTGYEEGRKDSVRPQGKWIWRETGTSICRYGYFTCSNCSFVSKAKQNFCAECGADMRKGGAE